MQVWREADGQTMLRRCADVRMMECTLEHPKCLGDGTFSISYEQSQTRLSFAVARKSARSESVSLSYPQEVTLL